MTRRRLGLLAIVLPNLAMTVEGNVIGVDAHWTADGTRIVTEATVRTPDGHEVVVSELGGTVDGLTMRTFPGPEQLELGMYVSVAAHEDLDLAQRMHVVVDGVKVMAYPAGFVRTGPTKAGHFLAWESGCAFVTPDAAGTKEIAGDGEFTVITAAVTEWNTKCASCSYFELKENPPVGREVGRDNINMIKFRDVSWCRPAIGDDPARCYPPAAAGLTTATFVDDAKSARDGAIVDADIELNGVDFAIAVNGTTTGNAPCKAELQNTLTHELGHLQGLEHPCLAAGDPPRVDGEGKPVPSCSATSDPKITEATMYNFQDCGETKKETLSDDDIAGICAIYPTAKDPGTCESAGVPNPGCCSASDGAATSALGTAALAAALFVPRRRRRFLRR